VKLTSLWFLVSSLLVYPQLTMIGGPPAAYQCTSGCHQWATSGPPAVHPSFRLSGYMLRVHLAELF
jgi:hypothetical protein